MSKNRIRSLRNITVNDVQYCWNVSDFDCDGDGSSKLKIWREKVQIHEELISGKIITPKIVSEKILEIIR